jgi:hypothetical protein
MYELLTGDVPHTGLDPVAAMTAHLTGTIVPIHTQRADVPAALEAVVLRALHRDPGDRYQTALEVLDDLDHLDELDVSSIDLGPEPPIEGVIGGTEAPAITRLVLAVAGRFLAIVAVIIVLSVVLR